MATQLFYITSTFKYLAGEKYTEGELYDIFLENITQWAKKYEKYILVLEHGKLGNNPHFNLIFPTTQTNTNLQKLFKNAIYRKHNFELTKHSVEIRLVNDLPTLITGYLEKEDEYKVLLNKGFDLEELKKHKVNKPKKIHRDLIHVNLETIPHIMYEYIHENEIVYNEKQQPVSAILNRMFKDGYTVMGLMKHARLIKHAVNTLFDFDTENLSEYIEKTIDRENDFYNCYRASPQKINKYGKYDEENEILLTPCLIPDFEPTPYPDYFDNLYSIKPTNIKVKL